MNAIVERELQKKQQAKENKILARYWNAQEDAIQRRGLEWTLTPRQYIELVEKNECFYCGTYFQQQLKYNEYVGLDRLDSTKGYVQENVVPCCFICNITKKTKTFEEFMQYVAEKSAYFEHICKRYASGVINVQRRRMG